MALPPLNFQSSSSSSLGTAGSLYHASGDGDWNVNFGTQGVNPWLLAALVGVAAWVIFKR